MLVHQQASMCHDTTLWQGGRKIVLSGGAEVDLTIPH